MSDYESSYYEIALTHRQVVVSFVVLLVFVAVVFLCGVWVGKNDSGASGDRVRQAQGASGAGDSDVPTNLDAVEEYSFDQSSADGASADASGEELDTPDLSVLEQPAPQTTLAQDLGRGQGSGSETGSDGETRSGDGATRREAPPREAPPPPSRPQASNQASSSSPSSSGASTESADEPSAGTSPPPVTSDDGPFRPSSTSPPPAPTPSSAEPSSGFVVQVFSGRDEDQARKVVETLEGDGYQAYLSPVRVDTQMRYRVRIGPYDDRGDAEGVERIVRQKYRYETWVTSAEN